MKHLVYIIGFLICLQGVSQEGPVGAVFVSNSFNSDSGIALKWISKFVYFESGVDIYRQEAGGSWQKINTSKVNVLTSIPSNLSISSEEKGLYDFLIQSSYSEFQDNVVKAFVAIKGIYNPDFAELVGMTYYDKTAVSGKSYTYKVVANMNGSSLDVGVSKEITCGNYTPTAAPNGIKLERLKTSVNLVWEPELYRYYGVNIYRKTGQGDFEKITKTPRAIQKGQNQDGEMTFPEVFYEDVDLDPTQSYVYKLEAIDYLGQPSVISSEYTAPARDFDPPQPPFDLRPTGHALEQLVDFNWQGIDELDLAGYNLYRSSTLEGPYTKVNPSLIVKSDRKYTDKVPQPGPYYYYLSSVDASMNESKSGKVFIEIRDMVPPAAPQNFTSEASEGKISFRWDANTEPDLKGYFLQRSLNDEDNSDNSYINVNTDPILENSWSQELPKNIRNKFVYRVIAVDTSYNRSKPSVNSLAQMPDVVAPRAPQIKEVLEKENLVITWIQSPEMDLSGYDIFRRELGDTTEFRKLNINPIPKTINQYTDRKAEPGLKYQYVLKANDENGNTSEASNIASGGLKKEQIVAAIVINESKLNVKKKSVSIAWEIDQEEVEIRGYVVYKTDEKGILKPYTGLLNDLKFADNIVPGNYQYQIRGYLASGEVLKSDLIPIELIESNN